MARGTALISESSSNCTAAWRLVAEGTVHCGSALLSCEQGHGGFDGGTGFASLAGYQPFRFRFEKNGVGYRGTHPRQASAVPPGVKRQRFRVEPPKTVIEPA